jgi:hypothetical protein
LALQVDIADALAHAGAHHPFDKAPDLVDRGFQQPAAVGAQQADVVADHGRGDVALEVPVLVELRFEQHARRFGVGEQQAGFPVQRDPEQARIFSAGVADVVPRGLDHGDALAAIVVVIVLRNAHHAPAAVDLEAPEFAGQVVVVVGASSSSSSSSSSGSKSAKRSSRGAS